MPPTRLLLPRLGPFHLPRSPLSHPRRTFLSSILSSAAGAPPPPQTLTASRRLPYNHAALYALIADIDSYSAFLPYCSVSRVTAWTPPRADPDFGDGRRWPTRADLTAGWGGIEQTYTSRVFCVPGSIVEALSGDGARSGIAPDVLARHGLSDDGPPSAPLSTAGSGEGVFKTLVTRWTVTPVQTGTPAARGEGAGALRTGGQPEWSDVNLNIRFQFANPLFGAVSSAIADRIAPVMIEAFVDRAKKVLG
ncbi:hypothetical protein GGS24DRAFT_383886 [Hypoxylon argillaceum]|nr:hypothetical protein GGS24DRAFT_383886 [Hypoxylon argillaceum]KAI1155758.1 hypothetical protein F4825DRAFT_10814 [Nemania diffusa]